MNRHTVHFDVFQAEFSTNPMLTRFDLMVVYIFQPVFVRVRRTVCGAHKVCVLHSIGNIAFRMILCPIYTIAQLKAQPTTNDILV